MRFTLQLVDLTLSKLDSFLCVLSSADFFQNHLFQKKYFRNTIRVSNSLIQPVEPDLGPNCLQMLSADDTSKQRVKVGVVSGKVNYGKPYSAGYFLCTTLFPNFYPINLQDSCLSGKLFDCLSDKLLTVYLVNFLTVYLVNFLTVFLVNLLLTIYQVNLFWLFIW